MGRRGPKPKAERAAEPSTPASRAAATTAWRRLDLASIPAELVGNAAAMKVWTDEGPEPVERGVLAETDRHLFAAYCLAVATVQDFSLIARRGRRAFLRTAAATEARMSRAEVVRLARELGFSPDLRGGRAVGDDQDEAADPEADKRARYFGSRHNVLEAVGAFEGPKRKRMRPEKTRPDSPGRPGRKPAAKAKAAKALRARRQAKS